MGMATRRLTILGCGSAGGVPAISSGWGECDPAQPRNRRRRSSVLVDAVDPATGQGTTRVLVDTSPDMRAQLLDAGVRHLDGVVYTHAHADHVMGIDDLREINRAMNASIPVWADPTCMAELRTRFSYVFTPLRSDANLIYKPLLECHEVASGPFRVKDLDCLAFSQDHGYCQTLGLRFGPIAYSTDVVALDDAAFSVLEGVDTWVVGCITTNPRHPTHASLSTVLSWVERLQPHRTILTHLGTGMDYDTLRKTLPAGIEPAYDGMVIDAG